jgi:DNA-binding ferritin-like protein
MEIQIIQSTDTSQDVSTETSADAKTQYFGTILNRFLSNIKMVHWYIRDYNKHEIFGNLYTDLSELFDSLQEEIIGTQRATNLDFPEFDRDSTFHDEELQYYIDDKTMVDKYFVLYNNLIDILLSNEFTTYTEQTRSGILNIRDEIVSRLNKTNYLINLTNI